MAFWLWCRNGSCGKNLGFRTDSQFSEFFTEAPRHFGKKTFEVLFMNSMIRASALLEHEFGHALLIALLLKLNHFSSALALLSGSVNSVTQLLRGSRGLRPRSAWFSRKSFAGLFDSGAWADVALLAQPVAGHDHPPPVPAQ